MAGTAIPIRFRRKEGGGNPEMMRIPESNNEVFKVGTPVIIAAGYLKELTEANNNNTFFGFSTEVAKNRAAAGVVQHLTYGAVENQANAQIIPQGAPMDDGAAGVILAKPGVRFMGKLDCNLTANLLGTVAGLTEDTNNYWYVDPSEVGAGNEYVLITDLIDPVNTVEGRVEFEVLANRIQSNTGA